MGLSESRLLQNLLVWTVHQLMLAVLAAAVACVLYPVIRRWIPPRLRNRNCNTLREGRVG